MCQNNKQQQKEKGEKKKETFLVDNQIKDWTTMTTITYISM